MDSPMVGVPREMSRPSHRVPTHTPRDREQSTFSSTLTNASLEKVDLTKMQAKACDGVAGAKGYVISWTSVTPPHMTSGLDIPSSRWPAQFSEQQRIAFETFELFRTANLTFHVVTRVQRATIEESWRGLTSMPSPTLPPYPFYSCNFIFHDKMFQTMKEIPPRDDSTIRKHHQHRTWNWQSRYDGGFEGKEDLYDQLGNPFTFIVNEREYEAIRMIALLRERNFAIETGTPQWNENYEFDIFRASDAHNSKGRGFDQYFYGVIEGSPRVKGPKIALEDFEQTTPTPDPGTLLTIAPREGVKDKSNVWEGVVVSSQGILEDLGGKRPFNAIFVRLKRPVAHDQGGFLPKLSGYVSFVSPSAALAQARRAIRYAINDVPKEKRSLEFIRTIVQEDRLSKKQTEAVQSAFSDADTWHNFLTLISGPPGTGKTTVSLDIAVHCLESKWPSLIVCGFNHGLDILANRVTTYLTARQLSTQGIYRLRTESLEAFGMKMPSTFHSFGDSEDSGDSEDEVEDPIKLPQSSSLEADLCERGFLSDALRKMVVASVQGMVVSGRNLTLTERILSALKSLLSGDQAFRTQSKINNCLWEFVTSQELLRRHSNSSAQSKTVKSPSKSSAPDNDTFGLDVETLTTQLKALWLKLQELYLNDARVVFCTASTAGQKASHRVESQSLNPIMRNYHSLRKVVLNGDIAQLPPFVLSLGANECSRLEQVSFSERMIKTGHPHIQLNVQYRMAPEISEHVSKGFYNSSLITHPSCINRPKARQFAYETGRIFNTRFGPGSSFFLSVSGSSLWRRKGGTSMMNPAYVDKFCFVVFHLCKAGIKQEDISVLSFYLEERRALSEIIHNRLKLKSIVIKSVDASQGSESAFVILSTTRPGGEAGLGFVQNVNRQCVALSRAQDGFVIVGHENMAKGKHGIGYEIWNNLVQSHASGRRLVKVGGKSEEVMTMMKISKENWKKVQ
ncbi:unnamed protein product [Penicillium salamii]|nr:unnamed protein product [Penicillium salamii]CAG8265992.1 unnamed protein product [Penicillium salamii]